MSVEDSISNAIREMCEKRAGHGAQLADYGQIGCMDLPVDWIERDIHHIVVGTSSLRVFSPEEKPDVKLCFYFRGHRMNKEAGSRFRSILNGTDRVLSQAEIESIADVLEGKSRPRDFDLTSARVCDMQGRRVLIVEGRWKRIQEQIEAVYIDADKEATLVQELFYQAPANSYGQFLPAARTAFASIEWKPSPAATG